MPTVQLLINATAGSASSKRTAALIHAFEAAGARVIATHCSAGAIQIDPETDRICVVGGDGTLRHAATAAAATGRTLPISIYPAGTVNLIARECEYPRDVAQFVARALQQPGSRLHHVALIGDVMLFGVASVGPDSFAVANLKLPLKRLIGRTAYVCSFLQLLWRWRRPRLHIAVDGQHVQGEAVYVAKGKYFAGPWSFAPQASVQDALLHVIILRRARRIDFARFVWALWRRHDLADRSNLVALSGSEVRIDGDQAPLQADGDIVAPLPVSIRLRPEPLIFA